jgi:hypothetical protein
MLSGNSEDTALYVYLRHCFTGLSFHRVLDAPEFERNENQDRYQPNQIDDDCPEVNWNNPRVDVLNGIWNTFWLYDSTQKGCSYETEDNSQPKNGSQKCGLK